MFRPPIRRSVPTRLLVISETELCDFSQGSLFVQRPPNKSILLPLAFFDYRAIINTSDTEAANERGTAMSREVLFSEYHYTGNSSHGDNIGNYDELAQWFKDAGLTVKDDDLAFLMCELEPTTGEYSLTHRGKTIRYRVQRHRNTMSQPQFGYRTNMILTLLD